MATKYDTNPLDPDFPEKARAAAAAEQETQTLNSSGVRTERFPDPAPTEDQTRRFTAPGPPYSPPIGAYPGAYQPVGFANVDRSPTRKVEKVGLPENVLTALPYLPWFIGLVAGLIILFLVPNTETKVRFHAAQGVAAHIGILIVTTMLGIIGAVTGIDKGEEIFTVVATILLFVWAYKAWKGRPVHIESVEKLTNWFEEKIQPSK